MIKIFYKEIKARVSNGPKNFLRKRLRAKGWLRVDEYHAGLPDSVVYSEILKLNPDTVLDVGSNSGQFALALREAGFTGRIISFEPVTQTFRELEANASRDANWQCWNLALGDKPGELPIHISGSSLSTSLLPIGNLHIELMPQSKEVGVEMVKVVKLDDWAEGKKLGARIYLKLDDQGYELAVLRGASQLLKSVVGAVVELNFRPLFDGQSKYHEVLREMETYGFFFSHLTSVYLHPQAQTFLWADAVFRPNEKEKIT